MDVVIMCDSYRGEGTIDFTKHLKMLKIITGIYLLTHVRPANAKAFLEGAHLLMISLLGW